MFYLEFWNLCKFVFVRCQNFICFFTTVRIFFPFDVTIIEKQTDKSIKQYNSFICTYLCQPANSSGKISGNLGSSFMKRDSVFSFVFCSCTLVLAMCTLFTRPIKFVTNYPQIYFSCFDYKYLMCNARDVSSSLFSIWMYNVRV